MQLPSCMGRTAKKQAPSFQLGAFFIVSRGYWREHYAKAKAGSESRDKSDGILRTRLLN